MKPDLKNIDGVVKRYLPSASKDDMQSDIDGIMQRLETGTAHAIDPKIQTVAPWRMRLAVAAAMLLIVFAGTMVWRHTNAIAFVENGDGSHKPLAAGEIVRASDAGSMLMLADGSRVEMRAQSELWLEHADDGVRIRLSKGDVIVNAAKQHGHLYVQTKDVIVSVVGTVFLVKAEEQGSRVAVIQGEVRVQQQGETETKLRPGDQVMTKPLMEWRPVSEEFSWSRSAPTHLALLQQSVVPPAEPREAFEVVSVRRSVVVTPGGGGGGRGGGGPLYIRNVRSPGEPCSRDSEPVVDPRRFDTSNTTLYNLVAWAYGVDCRAWRGGSDFLFGGPGWTKDDGFDIQAVIPEGAPSYTADQFRAHNAPKLQKMLQSMLEDRFSLVVHREMKDMQVYVLTVAKGGPKLISKPVNPNPESPTGRGSGGMLNAGLQAWKEGDNPCCNFVFDGLIWDQKQSIAKFASKLRTVLGQPVLDRTGLTGEFNYLLRYQPRNLPNPDGTDLGAMIERDFGLRFPTPAPRSIAAALEQDFGLHLEFTRERVEVLVIDRVEKPSEN